MKVKHIKTWEEFEEELAELNTETEQLKAEQRGFVSPMLFRGQSDSKSLSG